MPIRSSISDVETDRWFFANDHGEPHPIGESALRSALREGRIQPTNLLWRPGWKSWIAADKVRQFTQALGARARAAEEPRIDLKQKLPPPLPGTTTPTHAEARLSTPIPPAHRQKPLVRRPPIPTITEGVATSGGTLRPPGAVPPPPRGIPKTVLGDSGEWDPNASDAASLADMSSIQPLASQRPSVGQVRPSASIASVQLQARSHSTGRHEVLDQLGVPPEELSSPQYSIGESDVLLDPDSIETRPSAPNLGSRLPLRTSLRLSQRSILVLTMAAASLSLGIGLILQRPRHATPALIASKGTATRAPRISCRVARPAQRISPSVLMTVAPLAADKPVDGRLVIGYAENPTTATGLAIDPTDLNVRFPFRETKERRVTSVVPLCQGDRTIFHVVREDSVLKQARAVDANHDFLFGLSESGFSRLPFGGAPETIWPVEGTAPLTDPRLSSLVGLGHAVTFRQGGQAGNVMFGWLTEEGGARAGPFIVKSSATFVGTPSVTTNASSAMLAYAGRSAESEPWRIYLSSADVGQPPRAASVFTQPPGGPGGDSIAPNLAALPYGQWLLQWAEGTQGQRQVRIQTLDNAGHPIGNAHTVSPVGSNSGQGLLWTLNASAVSLFVINVGRSAELWAAPISCSE